MQAGGKENSDPWPNHWEEEKVGWIMDTDLPNWLRNVENTESGSHDSIHMHECGIGTLLNVDHLTRKKHLCDFTLRM